MSDSDLEKILRLVGINFAERKWSILEVILSHREKNQQGLTFAELKEKLEELEGKSLAKPLIYRYLKDLEEKGILYVDRTQHKNLYIVDSDTLIQSLRTLRSIAVLNLTTEQRNIAKKMELVSAFKADELASAYIELLIGKKIQDVPLVASGIQAVFNLGREKISEMISDGGTIRVSLEWKYLSHFLESVYLAESTIVVHRKMKIKLLLTEIDSERLASYRESSISRMNTLFGDFVEFRISRKQTKTYQGIYLGRDGIILFLSTEPYSAMWIPISSNPPLVEDVLATFKEDFSKARPMELR